MDKYQLIDSIICDLDGLSIQGVTNMNIVVNCVRKLSALAEGLHKEEAAKQECAATHEEGGADADHPDE